MLRDEYIAFSYILYIHGLHSPHPWTSQPSSVETNPAQNAQNRYLLHLGGAPSKQAVVLCWETEVRKKMTSQPNLELLEALLYTVPAALAQSDPRSRHRTQKTDSKLMCAMARSDPRSRHHATPQRLLHIFVYMQDPELANNGNDCSNRSRSTLIPRTS